MAEYLSVQVMSGPEIQQPALSLISGTLTVSIPDLQRGTVQAGTISSTVLPDGALGQIVFGRLLPAWEEIRAQAIRFGGSILPP